MTDEFQAYDIGYRMGIFHKCNGIDRLNEWEYFGDSIHEAFFDAYNETYDNHERKI